MFALFTDPAQDNTRSLIAAICCAVVCGLVFGLTAPLISLQLEYRYGSGLIEGYNVAAGALSTVLLAPFAPHFMRLLTPRVLLIASLVFAGTLFSLFTVFTSAWAWFFIRLVVGSFITMVFVISETWINQIVSPERRAFMLGVYGTALAGGFGVGALIFAVIDQASGIGFYIAGAILLFGTLPVALLKGPGATAPDHNSASLAAIIRAMGIAPAAIAAGLAFGAMETLMFSMIPVYAIRLDFAPDVIGAMMFAAAMGGIFIQIPLGWIADKTDRRKTLVWIALASAIGPLLIWQFGTQLLFVLPLLFIQAGVASGLYTVGLALLGERFSGGAIAAGNAAMITVYGLGSLFAPPATGIAMDSIGPHGLMLVLSIISGSYFLFLLFVRGRPQEDS
jgi:MFS family permease